MNSLLSTEKRYTKFTELTEAQGWTPITSTSSFFRVRVSQSVGRGTYTTTNKPVVPQDKYLYLRTSVLLILKTLEGVDPSPLRPRRQTFFPLSVPPTTLLDQDPYPSKQDPISLHSPPGRVRSDYFSPLSLLTDGVEPDLPTPLRPVTPSTPRL